MPRVLHHQVLLQIRDPEGVQSTVIVNHLHPRLKSDQIHEERQILQDEKPGNAGNTVVSNRVNVYGNLVGS